MSSPDPNPATESGAISLEVVPSSLPSTVTRAEAPGDVAAPASPTLSREEFAWEFVRMAGALNAVREEIVSHAAELSLAAPDADALVNGLCAISKVCSSLNSWLLGAQVATRLGQPIKTN